MSDTMRFRLYFYNKDAAKEYQKLDGSVKLLVDLGYRKLSMRADEIGKPLSGRLSGCKELKFRKDGIRVIFRMASENEVEIVDIIVTGKRADGEVFATAEKRLERSPERIGGK